MLFVTLSCVTAAQLPSERRDPLENSSDELVVNADSQPLAFGRPRPRLPHSSYLGVYGRAVLMLATVVVAQTVGSASWMGPLAGPVLAWSALRAEYALPVTTAGAFVMYAASDTMSQSVAQQCEHQPACNIDYKRAARTGLSASVLSGALAYFYYAWLDRAIGVPRALSSRLVPGGLAARALLPALPIAGKIAIDIGLFEPVYDTLYITLQALLRGEDLATAGREIRAKVLGIWAKAPPYWAPLDLINFSLVSLRLRPLFNALATIPWSMYLSAQANAALPTVGEEDGSEAEAEAEARAERGAHARRHAWEAVRPQPIFM